jgi:hypothetical protein
MWSKISGPGNAVFGDTAQPATSATFAAPGDYVLRLSAANAFAEVVDDLAVNVSAPPQIFGLSVNHGVLGFQVSGPINYNYAVQASTNLVTWTNLFTTNPAATPFGWSDLLTTNFVRRFYRVSLGP